MPVRRRPPPSRAPLVILASMLLLGLLVVTNRFRLGEAGSGVSAVRTGCLSVSNFAVTPPASPLIGRVTAPFVAVATVESNSLQHTEPSAATPDLDWVRVTYRVEQALRNDIGCQQIVEVDNPVPRGAPLSNQDAPLPGTRVLVFARAGVAGQFRHITHSAPPLPVAASQAVYRVERDRASPAPVAPGDPTVDPVLRADVALDDPSDLFLTPGPETEFPARLTLTNTTGEVFDPALIGPSGWRVSLVGPGDSNVWSAAVGLEEGQLQVLDPGFVGRVDVITKPTGTSQLREGIYRVQATLETEAGPINSDESQNAVVRISCVFGCSTTG